VAYLKAKYTTKNKGIQHIIQSIESKTELSIVICKECFDNERQQFAKCVNKQSAGRYSNWIRHLQLIHGIENEKAAVKAKEEATLALAVVDRSNLYTVALDKGNVQVIKGLHLLIARTVTNVGLPDRAIESQDLRNLLNYCFAHGNQL
jgi:hypothetical protein